MLADCSSLANKLRLMNAERERMVALKEKYAGIRKSLIKTKTESIRLNAEIELTKLGTADSDMSDFNSVQGLLTSLQKQVKALEKSKTEVEKELIALSEGSHPEALLIWDCSDQGEGFLPAGSASPRASSDQEIIPAKILRSGFVIHGRQLSDYEQVRILNGQNAKRHVFLVQLKTSDGPGPLKVLKEITLEEEKSRKSFENEFQILKKLNHPNVVPIEGIFYEGFRAYIQMPFLEGGTLLDWAKQRPTLSEIQIIFRQVFQSLSYLHDQKIIHRDIKLENVLMTSHDRPVVCDFGISRIVKQNTMSYTATDELWTSSITSTVTGDGTAVKGTEGYISPEVLEGGALTPAADIWAAGVMLFRAMMLSRDEIYDQKMKGRKFVAISSDPSFPDQVRDLFARIFTLDASSRISANEVLSSGFIKSSLLSYSLMCQRNLECDRRIEAAMEHFGALRKTREEVLVSVSSEAVVHDTIRHFKQMHQEGAAANDSEWFLRPIACKDGPAGSLFSRFFAGLVENGLLEAARSDQAPHFSVTYLPSSKHQDLGDFFSMGLIFAKALIDGHQVPSFFPSSFYKHLLGHELRIADLELYNYSLAFHLHEVLAKNLDIVSIEGTPNSRKVRKHEYVRYTIHQELVSCRSGQLESLKRGFLTGIRYAGFEPSLRDLTCSDLMILFCGHQQISPHVRLGLLSVPQPWLEDPDTTTARDLIDFVLHLSSNDLRRFLRFATGHCSLDRARSKTRINVLRCPKSNNKPVGRPCLRHMDLPDYNDKGLLQEKMLSCLNAIDEGGARMG